MAEARKTATRKPAAKKNTETVPPAVNDEVEKIKQELAQDIAEVEALVSEEEKALKGKTVQELRTLHDQALRAEDEAKRLVHILRQRAANAVVDVDIAAELAVIDAKKELGKAGQWVRHIENALENEFKDIYETRFGR